MKFVSISWKNILAVLFIAFFFSTCKKDRVEIFLPCGVDDPPSCVLTHTFKDSVLYREFTFDKTTQFIERVIEKGFIEYLRIYEYDNENNLVSYTVVSALETGPLSPLKFGYKYNDKKEMTNVLYYQFEEVLNETGFFKLVNTDTVYYDYSESQVKVTIEKIWSSPTNNEKRLEVYTLDENHNIVQQEAIRNGILLSRSNMEYDTKLNPFKTPKNYFFFSTNNLTKNTYQSFQSPQESWREVENRYTVTNLLSSTSTRNSQGDIIEEKFNYQCR